MRVSGEVEGTVEGVATVVAEEGETRMVEVREGGRAGPEVKVILGYRMWLGRRGFWNHS